MDRDLASFKSVQALDKWVEERGLSHNDEINMRRIHLMCEAIDRPHQCSVCGKRFKERKNLLQHEREKHSEDAQHECPLCCVTCTRLSTLKRHMRIVHKINDKPVKQLVDRTQVSQQPPLANPPPHDRQCKRCKRPLPERLFTKTVAVCDPCLTRREDIYQQVGGGSQSALKSSAEIKTLESVDKNQWDLLLFLSENKKIIEEYVAEKIQEHKGVKWHLSLNVRFMKEDKDGNEITTEPFFNTKTDIATQAAQLEEQIDINFQNLYKKFENFQREGSGWRLDKVITLQIKVTPYSPITASSFFPLPKYIQDKKAVLNIKNEDQQCFKWTVLAALHPVSRENHNYRVSHYTPHENELDWSMLDFPTPLSQIPKFEERNNVSINIFFYENESFYPGQITKYRFDQHVNVLLVSDGENRHFCLINNLSRLLGDRTKHEHHMYYCNYCLHGFTHKVGLQEHIPYCSVHGAQKVSLPSEEEKWLSFKNYRKGLRVPFVIYADFECILQDMNKEGGNTLKYQEHVPSGFCYTVISSEEKYCKPAVVYRGENVSDIFLEHMFKESDDIKKILSHVVPMKLTSSQELEFRQATHCHICEQVLGVDRVRDHDHLTGEYRGAAHNACNLNFKFVKENERKKHSFKIPVIFHNLRGYDSHLIIESLGKYKNAKPRCIANNMERYISISIENLTFIDSLQFMSASLDSLVNNLAKEGTEQFRTLKRHYTDPHQVTLLMQKGVYPYDYMNSTEKFEETQLPLPSAFYSKLNKEHITEEQYTHAQNVWRAFNIQNMGEYHDLYMKTDVLLLADVFENFRDLCLRVYKLDPAHYFTSPGLSWDAMLKYTKVKLERLTDPDMYLMFEAAVRGGISMISNKYSRANNKYLSSYDPTKPSTYIMYLDANNLYGWAMSQYLPMGDFDWLIQEQIDQLDIMSIPADSNTGYIFEVDLEYPAQLHDSHSDYPVAPENAIVTDDMLSEYSLKLKDKLDIKGKPTRKLVPNLHNKTRYVLHYRNLQFYLSQGLVLKHIHRGISFTQADWLKSYIDFNTSMRKQAKSDFEQDFYKLMNNSVFGKTMENKRKRMDVRLVNNDKEMKKLVAKPWFKTFKIFNEDLVGVHMSLKDLVLDKPIYVGMSILDLSKTLMYEFHYNYIKQKYRHSKLLFTDTDSLCYELETDDIYVDMQEDQQLYDTSNYDRGHALYNLTNKKIIGKMKDECGGKVVEEFVGLRSKMYSLCYGDIEKKTAKGVKRCEIRRLKHVNYRDCLLNNEIVSCNMNTFRSFNHQVFTTSMTKIGLSPFDDKRYVLNDGCDTIAHGHYKIV